MKDLTNKILKGDIKALEKLGLSMSQLKYSPPNQLGSIIIDRMMNRIKTVLEDKNRIEPPSLNDKYSRSAR